MWATMATFPTIARMSHGPALRRNADVIETALHGVVDVNDVEEMHGVLLDLLRTTGPARACIIDVSEISRFTPQVRVPGVPFLLMLRDHDIHLVVAKGAGALVRMTASAIALAASLPIKFVADDAEAAMLIAAHVTKSSKTG